jgi:hypothetical protein
MYGAKEYTEAGGLMACETNYLYNYRYAAVYVDKILKGARPADLPIEFRGYLASIWKTKQLAKPESSPAALKDGTAQAILPPASLTRKPARLSTTGLRPGLHMQSPFGRN